MVSNDIRHTDLKEWDVVKNTDYNETMALYLVAYLDLTVSRNNSPKVISNICFISH